MPNDKRKNINDLIRDGQRVTDARESARANQESEQLLGGPNETYLNLIAALVRHNQLSPEQVEKIVAHAFPPDPCDFAEFTKGFSEERRHAFAEQAKVVLKKSLDWPAIQKHLPAVIEEALKQREIHKKISDETRPLPSPRTIGAFWCGLFNHPGWFAHIKVPDLDFAYRGPSLFLSSMCKADAKIAFVVNDEKVAKTNPPLTLQQMSSASVVYLCTHGRWLSSGYEAYLHEDTWRPGKGSFGGDLPYVIVFDTCNLIEADNGWEKGWADVLRGGSVQLLLGFIGLTSIDRGSSRRGAAFAENVMQKEMSFANAWIDAVRTTAVTAYRHAVAIGVGRDSQEAQSALRLTMKDTSGPAVMAKLHSGPLFFAVKDLHETRVSHTAF